jgi:hypothetical protein
MMDDALDRGTGRIALGVGLIAAGSAVSLATFFAVQGPFGTLNDLGNATAGVLSAILAWRLGWMLSGRVRPAALAVAIAGAALSVVGSALVISQTTGFMFAGLVSSLGFAGVGLWLVTLNLSASAASWRRGLRRLGVAAGGLMALGVLLTPGIVMGLDDLDTAPAWVWIGMLGWLGIFVVYPAWAIWLGLRTERGRARAVTAADGAVAR